MLPILFEIIGWIGTVSILFAYFLNSIQKISSESKSYQLLNLLGAVFVIANVLYHRAYPSVALNIVWAIIALSALIKDIIRNPK